MPHREQSIGQSDEWYTPPHVFEALGCTFDLDVAHPGLDVVPWIPAERIISKDSLETPWSGFAWMNPPFGGRNSLAPWLEKFFAHGNGVALTPDRTSAPWWQRFAPQADAILFAARKIKFHTPAGVAGTPAQGSSFFAVGLPGVMALRRAASAGFGFVVMT